MVLNRRKDKCELCDTPLQAVEAAISPPQTQIVFLYCRKPECVLYRKVKTVQRKKDEDTGPQCPVDERRITA